MELDDFLRHSSITSLHYFNHFSVSRFKHYKHVCNSFRISFDNSYQIDFWNFFYDFGSTSFMYYSYNSHIFLTNVDSFFFITAIFLLLFLGKFIIESLSYEFPLITYYCSSLTRLIINFCVPQPYHIFVFCHSSISRFISR